MGGAQKAGRKSRRSGKVARTPLLTRLRKYLACYHYLTQAILAQKEMETLERLQQPFNLAIAVVIQQRIFSGTLHIHRTCVSQVISAKIRP